MQPTPNVPPADAGSVSEVEQRANRFVAYPGKLIPTSEPPEFTDAQLLVRDLLALVADLRQQQEQLQTRLRVAETMARRCEEENGAHCPEDRSCGETITALRGEQERFCGCRDFGDGTGRECAAHEEQRLQLEAAEATGEAAVSRLQKENEELKERLARVDGERRAAGPTGSTASTD